MFVAWVLFHVVVCVGLVLVVLLQSSKGEGLAGTAFGGGGGLGGAVFGGRGAGSFLAKATTVLAVLFMVNCIALAVMSASGRGDSTTTDAGESVVTREAQKERERYLEQQAQQQADSAASDIQVTPIQSTPTEAPVDSAGN